MARKLKIIENEKHPLDDLKNDEITEKRENWDWELERSKKLLQSHVGGDGVSWSHVDEVEEMYSFLIHSLMHSFTPQILHSQSQSPTPLESFLHPLLLRLWESEDLPLMSIPPTVVYQVSTGLGTSSPPEARQGSPLVHLSWEPWSSSYRLFGW